MEEVGLLVVVVQVQESQVDVYGKVKEKDGTGLSVVLKPLL